MHDTGLKVFSVFGIQVELAQSIINMWKIMGVLIVFALIVYFKVKKFKAIPDSKFQIFIEGFVDFIYGATRDNMGQRNIGLAPYVGSLALLLLGCNVSGLFAFKKIPTTDYSVTLGLAIATFLLVQYNQIKVHKVKGYFLELFDPIPALFPLKILEKFTPVLSMSLRLFCNITAGLIVLEIVYSALNHLTFGPIPIGMAFIPVPLHFYFDLFDSVIQTIVFTMLTMVLTAIATEGGHSEEEEHGHSH